LGATATRRIALSRISRTVLAAALLMTLTLAAAARAATPAVVVGGPATAITGQPVSFDGGASADPGGGPLTFAWTIDGEDVGVAHAWLSVAFAHAGRHVVSLTATDRAGRAATIEHAVDVSGADRSVESLEPLGSAVGSAVAGAPWLQVSRPAARVRDRRLRVVTRCRATVRCAGTLRAVTLVGRRHRPVLLAQQRFSLAPGARRVLRLRLSAAARRRLGRGATVRVTAYRGPVRTASIWATSAARVQVAR
jgi:hypothetical protein